MEMRKVFKENMKFNFETFDRNVNNQIYGIMKIKEITKTPVSFIKFDEIFKLIPKKYFKFCSKNTSDITFVTVKPFYPCILGVLDEIIFTECH